MPVKQQAEKEDAIVAGVIGSNHQEEINLFLHSADKEDYAWDAENLRNVLLLCP